ncbi:uncharacterized protein [Nicotiana tomentosiformis]|uniref:uncharacterized protein n=1 Tax=Nicotiana tomentosiformis TaxID=4098 RepID=UPI00388CA482
MPDTAETSVVQFPPVNGVNFDPNHPYFFHSSDAPGMTLVNLAIDGRGFQGLRRSILTALSTKNKPGFINGTCPAPAATSKYYQPCIEPMICLEHKFGRSNGAKLYHLRKELFGLVQATNDIAGYFTKLKRLWDELDSLNCDVKCIYTCVCDGKQKFEKSLEDERLIQFLMGLNDVYSQTRVNNLMMNPLPNINHAYSPFLQDENQRENNFAGQGNYSQKSRKQAQRNFSQSQRSANNLQKT